MPSRYAIYTRNKTTPSQVFAFACSFATFKDAREHKIANDKRFSNIETVIIESMNARHVIDPYHRHFAETETENA